MRHEKAFLFFLVSFVCVLSFAFYSCKDGPTIDPNPGQGMGSDNYYNADQGKGAVLGVEFSLNKIPIMAITLGTSDNSEKLDSDSDGAGNDLKNRPHNITLERAFRMGTTEVTQEMWVAVMKKNPSSAAQKEDSNPVDSVSFFDIIVFCNELTKKTRGNDLCVYYAGADNHIYTQEDANNKEKPHYDRTKKGFRLPTVGEWEAAASENGKFKYAGTSEKNEVEKFAWMKHNAGGITHKVGKKAAGAFGLYDMNGNVWEWCWDWMKDGRPNPEVDPSRVESNFTTIDDIPPSGVINRIKKGGGCVDSVTHNHVMDRRWGENPETRQAQIGFRIACND